MPLECLPFGRIKRPFGSITCFGKMAQNDMAKSHLSINDSYGAIDCTKFTQSVVFEVGLEVKEDDGKGNFSKMHRNRNVLKLRANVEKQVCLSIRRILKKNQRGLEMKQSSGILVATGWNAKNSDMRLLDTISENVKKDENDTENNDVYTITSKWDPKELRENINSSKLSLTVAIDLVLTQIKQPVRFTIETQCKICSQYGLLWSFNKSPIFDQFILHLKKVPSRKGNLETAYEVINTERLTVENSAWSYFANLIKSTSATSLEEPTTTDDFSDADEPMSSGTGQVSKECTDRELGSWNKLLPKWTDTNVKPKQLTKLVQQGIPDALRGIVWQLLANVDKKDELLLNQYRLLISKKCDTEFVIKKDIHRTFPAHDYFKEAGGDGQDMLFNISKAYAVYDTEIGYCQGLTFIAASLLLHMPEEQAFCVLVHLMYNYKLRNLYEDGFENLKMKLYQLDRLLEEKDPELWQHFRQTDVETHMFAHSWFLTLYTAHFPLYFVFSIFDVVLSQGLDAIFQIAIALLLRFKNDLIKLNFENIVKYIQVTLPKHCRNYKTVRDIITSAFKIKLKNLGKYEDEFWAMKAVQDGEKSNTRSKINTNLMDELSNAEEEKRQLVAELNVLKESLFLQIQKTQQKNKNNDGIISEYKHIYQPLNQEQANTKTSPTTFQNKIGSCERCNCCVNEAKTTVTTTSMNNDSGYSLKSENNRVEETSLTSKIKELELELAQTKLALMEAECKCKKLKNFDRAVNYNEIGLKLKRFDKRRNKMRPRQPPDLLHV